ncbi:MAG: hypothetical protein KatS3mg057_2770 [Herpetosiphonaceae bacterium]|nr:MAG: hypothetical protein KatS3mg057_2770 [Herpetosiphonaceae bacterium]
MPEFLADWQTLMAAVEHWLAGGNPYGEYLNYRGQQLHAGAFAYPPPALLPGAALALLPWQLSGLLLLFLSVIGFEYWARRTSGRIALPWLLLWLPLVQNLWIGQVTLLALVGIALAEMAYTGQRDRRAGVLLALALLKPQTVALPALWLLLLALRGHRWRLLAAFALTSTILWGGILLSEGPAIYLKWFDGLRAYGPELPNRPLLFPPFGPLLGIFAVLLWRCYGRGDLWTLLLLLNTLIYPLSVVYVASGVAFVIIRWRKDWPWYPLLLSWLIPASIVLVRTPDTIAALTQAIVATGLLAGLAPRLPRPWARWERRAMPR